MRPFFSALLTYSETQGACLWSRYVRLVQEAGIQNVFMHHKSLCLSWGNPSVQGIIQHDDDDIRHRSL